MLTEKFSSVNDCKREREREINILLTFDTSISIKILKNMKLLDQCIQNMKAIMKIKNENKECG